jgi:hypothetical protein
MSKNGKNYVASVVAVLIVIALVMSTIVFSLVGLSSNNGQDAVEVPVEVIELDPSADIAVPTTEPHVTEPTTEPVS